MSDLFSNLVALSLGSIVGVQPLVPPLFAPAPQLLSEATPPAFNDQVAGAAESTVFSLTPQIVADETGTPWMEQPSDEVVLPERRTMYADLVPPDIPQSAIDTYPQITSTEDDASRSLSVYRLLGKTNEVSMTQAIQPREATAPKAENPEISSSSILQKEQKQSAEKTFLATPRDAETQHTSSENQPTLPTVDAFHDQNLSTPPDKAVTPLPIQPALPVSIPLSLRDDLSEKSVDSDDISGKKSSSSMHPHIQSPSIPVHVERFIAPDPDVDESVSKISSSKWRTTLSEWSESPSQPQSGLDEHTIKPLLDQNTVVKERDGLQAHSEISTPEGIAQSTKARLRVPVDSEILHSISPVQPSNVHEVLHSSRVDSKFEAPGVEAESEVFPINVTIGRIVVRATQAAQPTPVKKRVIRPAQSLDEYLKQRERGSR